MISAGPIAHPNLLFNAEELLELRSRCRTGLRARILNRLRFICDELMGDGSPNHFDFAARRRDIWGKRYGIFTVVPSLTTLATTYAFTGDTRIGDYARDALMTIVDNNLADAEAVAWGAPTKGWRHGPGHDKAMFALSVVYVYDFCCDRFSEDQRKRLAEFAKESIALADEWKTIDEAQGSNNRGSRGSIMPALYCLAFQGEVDIPKAENRIQLGEIALERFMSIAIDPDGAPYEGPGYTEGNIFHAAFAAMLTRRGRGDFRSNARFERLLRYNLYELAPAQGCVNNLNDAEWPCGSVTPSLCSSGRPEAAILPWLATQLDLSPPRFATWLDDEQFKIGLVHERSLYWLLWWPDDLPAQTPAELGFPLSHCFRERGVASMRTGWERDAWLVSHFCGRQQLYCHRQGDQNHVALYALGEKFLVDAGYGDIGGDTTKPKDRWYQNTASHNCVLVNGTNQRGVKSLRGWGAGK